MYSLEGIYAARQVDFDRRNFLATRNAKVARLYTAAIISAARTTLTTVMSSSWPNFFAVAAIIAAG
jgi:hypothetical protein